MAQEETQRILEEKKLELDAKARENEKDRRRDLLVAEIRASGYGAMQDLNQNMESDFTDNMNKMRETDAYIETVDISRQKVNQNASQHADKMELKREELAAKREAKQIDMAIAQENKNQYDFKTAVKSTQKKTEKPKPKKKS
mgnify:FL=1